MSWALAYGGFSAGVLAGAVVAVLAQRRREAKVIALAKQSSDLARHAQQVIAEAKPRNGTKAATSVSEGQT